MRTETGKLKQTCSGRALGALISIVRARFINRFPEQAIFPRRGEFINYDNCLNFLGRWISRDDLTKQFHSGLVEAKRSEDFRLFNLTEFSLPKACSSSSTSLSFDDPHRSFSISISRIRLSIYIQFLKWIVRGHIKVVQPSCTFIPLFA
jgi:hypothetical protein